MIILLVALGLALGSFINAFVWRLHEKHSNKQPSKQRQLSILHGRSMCVHCRHQLAAVDLIPVVSWLALRGKCRYCHAKISWQYPTVELLTAGLLGISYAVWPYSLTTLAGYALFLIWLAVLTLGIALAVYDLRWMILPNRLVYPFGVASLVFTILLSVIAGTTQPVISGLVGSLGLGGFFYLLHRLSKGQWIGGGDIRLGFMLGLLLGWQKTIFCLTLAAYLGTFVIVILVVLRKYHRKMKLPFGPFLLLGAYAGMLWGQTVIDWYLRISGV